MSDENRWPKGLFEAAESFDAAKMAAPVTHSELWRLLVDQAVINHHLMLLLTYPSPTHAPERDEVSAMISAFTRRLDALILRGVDLG